MKRSARLSMATWIAALALAAVASGASAASFTYSATGEVTSRATSTQTLTVGGANVIKCTSAHGSSKLTSIPQTELEFTLAYSGCSATFFGFPAGAIDISPATYNFTANGEVHLLAPLSFKATGLGCETVFGKQTLKSVSYTNEAGKIKVAFNATGLVSTSPNGCPTGTSGSITGSNLWERVGGGTLAWDA